MTTTVIPTTLAADTFTADSITFKGKVDGLSYQGIVFDAAMVTFEYGLQSDLSDAQRVPNSKEKAVLSNMETIFEIQQAGLDMGTEYFYRALSQPLLWDDQLFVNEISKSIGFIIDAMPDETAYDKMIALNEFRTQMFTDPLARSHLLKCVHTESKIWNNASRSEEFWNSAGIFACSGGDAKYHMDIHTSGLTQVRFWFLPNSLYGDFVIKIDDTEIASWQPDDNFDKPWEEAVIDVDPALNLAETATLKIEYLDGSTSGTAWAISDDPENRYSGKVLYTDTGHAEIWLSEIKLTFAA